MCRSCDAIIDELWRNLTKNKIYKTPDNVKGKTFSITSIESDRIKISTRGININKKAFSATLHYLMVNRHRGNNPIEIRSNNDSEKAGPLCQTVRNNNGNVRCINYILPILCNKNIVGIDGSIANKTWVI